MMTTIMRTYNKHTNKPREAKFSESVSVHIHVWGGLGIHEFIQIDIIKDFLQRENVHGDLIMHEDVNVKWKCHSSYKHADISQICE